MGKVNNETADLYCVAHESRNQSAHTIYLRLLHGLFAVSKTIIKWQVGKLVEEKTSQLGVRFQTIVSVQLIDMNLEAMTIDGAGRGTHWTED